MLFAEPSPPEALLRLVGEGRSSIGELLEARAGASPDATFLIYGGERTSYAQALKIVRERAGRLLDLSGKDRPRVATFFGNSPEALWAWLATAYTGGTFVPLNRGHKGPLLSEQIDRINPDLILTDSEGVERFGSRDALFDSSQIDWQDTQPLTSPRSEAEQVATIMFTSGTTGRSKAVQVPHNQYARGAARLVDAFNLGSDDVFHNWLPLFHLAGQLHMTMTAIVSGGTVALFPTFSRTQFREQVVATGATVVCGFTSILNMIWSLPPCEEDSRSTLRVGIFAGIPDELRLPFEARFGIKLGDNYGMTEADPITLPGREAPPGSCGIASPDFEIAILDEQDRVLPAGAVGEIAARPRAAHLMFTGYQHDEDATLTAQRNFWFHTGDIGRLDEEGYLYFLGRKSGYIRRRGENISVAEIEALFLAHPEVAECAAVGVPSPLGEDDVKLVVVPVAESSLNPPELHRFACQQMARFMVPRFILITDSLPRTDLGKVSLVGLRELRLGLWDAEGKS